MKQHKLPLTVTLNTPLTNEDLDVLLEFSKSNGLSIDDVISQAARTKARSIIAAEHRWLRHRVSKSDASYASAYKRLREAESKITPYYLANEAGTANYRAAKDWLDKNHTPEVTG